MRRFVRFLPVFTLLLGLLGAAAPAVGAQEGGPDSAFRDSTLRSYGYPEVVVRVGPDGVEAPSTLTAGYHLVSLYAAPGYSAYLNFMQPPAGLSEEEATELALAAARDDLAQEGWVYAGGNNTFVEGVPTVFIINLAPGDYRIAASYYLPDEGSEEIMRLLPLIVIAPDTPAAASPIADDAAATPAATPGATDEPAFTVSLEETDDLRYIVSPDPVPAGPNVWRITNTGQEEAHHMVMVRLPDDVTADQIVAEFTSLMAGTPPAESSVTNQFTFVGYAALQSGGTTTFVELELQPGNHAVICYIFDPQTGRPHVIDGMVTTFTAE